MRAGWPRSPWRWPSRLRATSAPRAVRFARRAGGVPRVANGSEGSTTWWKRRSRWPFGAVPRWRPSPKTAHSTRSEGSAPSSGSSGALAMARAEAGSPEGIGLDVGGTKIAGYLIDGEGTILRKTMTNTPAESADATLEAMASVVRAVASGGALAVGIGMAG